MTWITDDTGTRWVVIPPRNRRKPSRALRFASIKVGDQLERKPQGNWYRHIPDCYIVSDLWFDPVAGQGDETAGRMVALQQIKDSGAICLSKQRYTIRGLAAQGFQYAGKDIISERKMRSSAMIEGSVVGIGRGKIIRARPKLPGL